MAETIVDIFLEAADRFKDRVAFQTVSDKKEEAVFYAQLKDSVLKITAELISWGIEKGGRIAILSENRPEWAYAYFAALNSGAAVVGMDINLKPQEVLFILKDARVSAIFVSRRFLGTILEIKKEAKLKKFVCFDENGLGGCFSLADILKKKSEAPQCPKLCAGDLAMLVYTSGTTGKSKAVMLSHGNIYSNLRMVQRVFRWRRRDNFLSLLPLSHMFELTGGLLCPLSLGARITYIDSLKPSKLIMAMEKTKVTHALLVPALIRLLRQEIFKQLSRSSQKSKFLFHLAFWVCAFFRIFNINLGRLVFSKLHQRLGGHLKYFVSGGAPLSPYLIWWFECLGIRVLQGYGLTEASPVVSANSPLENRLGSVGKPLPGLEVKIKDGLEEGEILVKGENVSAGYYKNPQDAKAAVVDGWLHTGDIGKIDIHGFLYVLGREKNVIVHQSGLKVYPEELEEELLKSPLIRDVCIIGKKDRGPWEEVVYALVVPDEEYMGMKLSNDREKMRKLIGREIKKLNSRFAAYKHIRGFELWGDLPKTATRKVKKELVKQTISQQSI